jgi:hypothetical protein
MGVDAEMVVVAPAMLTQKDITRLSYETGSAFGPPESRDQRTDDRAAVRGPNPQRNGRLVTAFIASSPTDRDDTGERGR